MSARWVIQHIPRYGRCPFYVRYPSWPVGRMELQWTAAPFADAHKYHSEEEAISELLRLDLESIATVVELATCSSSPGSPDHS